MVQLSRSECEIQFCTALLTLLMMTANFMSLKRLILRITATIYLLYMYDVMHKTFWIQITTLQPVERRRFLGLL